MNTDNYFSQVNPDLLLKIPLSSNRVLEIGCGEGKLAAVYQRRNPGVTYLGVELFEDAGRQASNHMHDVVVGDIEQSSTIAELDKRINGEKFDALLFGDVLEHLRDPWRVLAELRTRVSEGGVCIACIPNVSHWSLLVEQFKGRWDYADAGLLDRTHLRFFTLETAVELFERAGWTVLDATPRVLWPDKTKAALESFLPVSKSLGVSREKFQRDLSAFQWVIRAVNGRPPAPLNIAALGTKKMAGVTETRVDYPCAALASLPGVQARWNSMSVNIPSNWHPGIFVLHRQFMTDTGLNSHIERLIATGWVVIADIDDDPRHWEEFVSSNFYAFRAAHAVTVSTERMADLIRQWNPNVFVFPNAVMQLPSVPSENTPKEGDRLKIFFGAINRGADWDEVKHSIFAVMPELGDKIEFTVVHDQAVFESLPGTVNKNFYPTLPHEKYMQVLNSCDVALLPLKDTQFNRLKSDLKFIECCAAGVVPICSNIVYADQLAHKEIGVFPATATHWGASLLQLCSSPKSIKQRKEAGLAYIKRERMHSHWAAVRKACYHDLMENHEVLERERRSRLAKVVTK